MQYAGTFCLLLAVASVNAANISPQTTSVRADQTLMQFMLQSRGNQEQNPQRSMGCFDYYIPQLNAFLDRYNADYALCVNTAGAARTAVDESKAAERNDIWSRASSACSTLGTCIDHVDSVNYFYCFQTESTLAGKEMYSISTKAQDIWAEVRENYRLIDVEESLCKVLCERKYSQDTDVTYAELQECLDGKINVPTTAPPED